MREDILLREISTAEIWAEVQKLRNELQTHNHLTSGSQLLTGEVAGILQSTNFVSGSSGWRILPESCEFNDGIFRGTLSAASGTLGTITSGVLHLGELSGGQTHSIIIGDTTYSYGVVMKDYQDNTTVYIQAGTGDASFWGNIYAQGSTFISDDVDDAGSIGLYLAQQGDCTETSNIPILAKLEIDDQDNIIQ